MLFTTGQGSGKTIPKGRVLDSQGTAADELADLKMQAVGDTSMAPGDLMSCYYSPWCSNCSARVMSASVLTFTFQPSKGCVSTLYPL